MFAQVSRFKLFSMVLALMACIVLWPTSNLEAANLETTVSENPAVICHNTGDMELYTIPTYKSIGMSNEYIKLIAKLTKEERLVEATTIIKYFKGCKGELLISHDIIAKPSKIAGQYKAPEYVTFISDSSDIAEKFSRNAIDELGYKVQGAYGFNWADKDMYLVALQR